MSAAVPALSLLCASADAALVVDYQYDDGAVNATDAAGGDDAGVFTNTSPTATASGITYEAGNSRGGAGSHVSFDFIAVTDAVTPSVVETQDALKNAAGATLLTDFRFDTVGSTNDNVRFIYFSRGTTDNRARAEVSFRSNGDGTYDFVAGGRSADSDSFQSFRSSAVTIEAGVWHSVAAVLDYATDEISIFFDGQAIGSGISASFSANATSNTDSVVARIGSDHDGPFYIGDLDNTLIYNSALTDAEAVAATIIPEPASLVLLALGGVVTLGRRRSA